MARSIVQFILPPCSQVLHRHGIGHARRRGFTLVEALMASGILLVVVLSVTTAISAGQQHAYESQVRVAASLAAEELLGRVTSDTYSHLSTWDKYSEPVGTMTDLAGKPMPPVFHMIGRSVSVSTTLLTVNTALDVRVNGATVQVRALDGANRVLASLSRFIPEPQP